jgi:hypothetical protein
MRNTAAAMELTATDVKQVTAAQEQMATELVALRQATDSDHGIRRVTTIFKRVLGPAADNRDGDSCTGQAN